MLVTQDASIKGYSLRRRKYRFLAVLILYVLLSASVVDFCIKIILYDV